MGLLIILGYLWLALQWVSCAFTNDGQSTILIIRISLIYRMLCSLLSDSLVMTKPTHETLVTNDSKMKSLDHMRPSGLRQESESRWGKLRP